MEKNRIGASAHAAEEASMEATTSSTSSTVVAALGSTALSNNETSSPMKFAPAFSISEWTNEAQKMVSTTTLLRSLLQDEHASNAAASECSSKLEVEITRPEIASSAGELQKFCNRREVTTPGDHSTIVSFHNFFPEN